MRMQGPNCCLIQVCFIQFLYLYHYANPIDLLNIIVQILQYFYASLAGLND
jgi:hypothetical protein